MSAAIEAPVSASFFIDIHGYRAEIRSSNAKVVDHLGDDFAFFRSDSTGTANSVIDLFEEEPPYEELPPAKATVYTPRNVSYRIGAFTYIDYSGRALGIYDQNTGNFRIFSRNVDLLYEAAYLFLLLQAGERLDAAHLHRVHALGVSVNDRAALILLPMGGGKSTLGSHLLRHREVCLLSDDSPLIDHDGNVHAFPLRIGLLPGSEGAIPDAQLRKIERMEFGPKLLVNYSYFADRVRERAEPGFIFMGRRSLGTRCEVEPASKAAALRALFVNCIVGMGLFQGMEFVFSRGAGELVRKAGVAMSRLRASMRVLSRSQTYYLTLGRDSEENARVLLDLLRSAPAQRARKVSSPSE